MVNLNEDDWIFVGEFLNNRSKYRCQWLCDAANIGFSYYSLQPIPWKSNIFDGLGRSDVLLVQQMVHNGFDLTAPFEFSKPYNLCPISEMLLAKDSNDSHYQLLQELLKLGVVCQDQIRIGGNNEFCLSSHCFYYMQNYKFDSGQLEIIAGNLIKDWKVVINSVIFFMSSVEEFYNLLQVGSIEQIEHFYQEYGINLCTRGNNDHYHLCLCDIE